MNYDMQNEHDMGAGQIAVTSEFLTKLLSDVAEQSPDDEKIELLIKALTSAVDEDRSLDMQDIPAVMAKMKEMSDSGSSDMDDDMDTDTDMDDDISDDMNNFRESKKVNESFDNGKGIYFDDATEDEDYMINELRLKAGINRRR